MNWGGGAEGNNNHKNISCKDWIWVIKQLIEEENGKSLI